MLEKGESVKTKIGSESKVLNKFFSNTAKNLEILKCSKYESFVYIIEDQALRAILKYKNHPSIIQKQPLEVFCEKRCSLKCCIIHRKTPVPESLF